ncbi:MAG: FAD-dependent oxidoreductase, partial [Sphingomonadaceae bacterium]|nr:FAD-dependent oxidoreductase [Sphingomonadaceae bacterium]
MAGPSRRSVILSGAGAAAAAALPKGLAAQPGRRGAGARAARRDADVIVVGAGVFGAWTAARLRAEGRSVLLVDAWGPGHARASSGGESRMTRGAYGGDAIYSRMARDSLEEWRVLSARADLPLFHETGVLFFFPEIQPYFEETMQVHRRLGLPTALLDSAEL